MKKFITALMTAAMVMSLSVPVFAAEYSTYEAVSDNGTKVIFEAAYAETKTIPINPIPESSADGNYEPYEQTVTLITAKAHSNVTVEPTAGNDPFLYVYVMNNTQGDGYRNAGFYTLTDTSDVSFTDSGLNLIMRLNDNEYYRIEGSNLTLDSAAEPEAPAEQPAAPAPDFTDVPADKYYAAPVRWAVENNITSGTGDGKFSPDKTCSESEILTFLYRAAGSPEVTVGAEKVVGDWIKSEFYYNAAGWGFENLILDVHFNPAAPCTRATAVEYIWVALGCPDAAESSFTDVSRDSRYASAVDWAVEAGVTSGTGDGKFSPDATCTRGQIATFLYKAMGK